MRDKTPLLFSSLCINKTEWLLLILIYLCQCFLTKNLFPLLTSLLLVPILGDKRGNLVVVLIFCPILIGLPNIVTVNAERWIQVAKWTEPVTSSRFNCNHVSWDVHWNFKDIALGSTWTIQIIDIDALGNNVTFFKTGVGSFVSVNSGQYTHNQSGRYQITIDVDRINDFEVFVRQDIDSIPEFPSWTLLTAGFFAVTVLSIFYKRKFRQRTNSLK